MVGAGEEGRWSSAMELILRVLRWYDRAGLRPRLSLHRRERLELGLDLALAPHRAPAVRDHAVRADQEQPRLGEVAVRHLQPVECGLVQHLPVEVLPDLDVDED